MAIDTEDKRRSAQGHGGGLVVAPLVDGAINRFDRRQIAGYYRSFDIGSLPAIAIIGTSSARLRIVGGS